MRLSSAIIALIAASAAAAQGFDFAKFAESSSEDCKSEVKKYTNCLTKVTEDNYKDICKVIEKDDCVKFFAKPNETCLGNVFSSSKVAAIKAESEAACQKFTAPKTTEAPTTTGIIAAATEAVADAANTVADGAAAAGAAVAGAAGAAAGAVTDAAGNAVNATANAVDNAVNATANAANATVNNVVAGNSTATNANTNTSDATRLTASLFVTLALVMLTFY